MEETNSALETMRLHKEDKTPISTCWFEIDDVALG